MTQSPLILACRGCGAVVNPAEMLPFRCPAARVDDDIDHVLHLPPNSWMFPALPGSTTENPFWRYRHGLLAWRLARSCGDADGLWGDLVAQLDEALVRVDGRPVRVTPAAEYHPLGCDRSLWIKDETGSVAGSHKARHLVGVLLYLLVLERLGLPAGEGLRKRRLAIASCGNAALAAGVVARAADWPVDVYIPPDADASVVSRLTDLGASVHVCCRIPGEIGDPCAHAFRRAVAEGALPFSVQGPDNGLVVEGAKTLVWELLESVASAGARLDALYVQVGGGALASGCWQGLVDAQASGLIRSLPRLFPVQAEGCHPLGRAWEQLRECYLDRGVPTGSAMAGAMRQRSRFMTPWPTVPHSIASGILDDETYDWQAVLEGVAQTGGSVLMVSEHQLGEANRVAGTLGFQASPTGSASLAGWLAHPVDGTAAVLMTGVRR